MAKWECLIFVTLAVLASQVLGKTVPVIEDLKNEDGARVPKSSIPSSYKIVRFANDPCPTPHGKMGTCYTAEECKEKKGVHSGPCAEGYGVCCVVTLSCGQSSSENNTYFDSGANEGGHVKEGVCKAEICPCRENICQIRLDFISFEIAGPYIATLTNSGGQGSDRVLGLSNGVPADSGPNGATTASRCLTDKFTVSGGNGGSDGPPAICGTNNNEHMYVDSGDYGCQYLTFLLGPDCDKSVVHRHFSIKVTQYACDYTNLAPQGCTQYFFGQSSNSVRSYNFNYGKGRHLANQDQHICVRRERGNCRICYYVAAEGDFAVSGTAQQGGQTYLCGEYPDQGPSKGFDFLQIPQAMSTMGRQVASAVCGRKSLVTASLTPVQPNNKTICSRRTPFVVNFRSDAYESADSGPLSESFLKDVGFQLWYVMDSTHCDHWTTS